MSRSTARFASSGTKRPPSERYNIELAGTGGSEDFTLTNVAALVLLDAGAGADTLAYTGDGNMVVTDALLTRTAGTLTTTVPLGSIETLRLNGGVGADSFNLTNWTKTAIVSGGWVPVRALDGARLVECGRHRTHSLA